ncbi:gamma-glutamyltransferase [Erwinia mallotivora]|uniref:gamma-glutamyltransferase n=1 Tax=Erwinia mallotivora TaxID=69222 RepID=UPI0035E96FA1
MAGLLCWQGAVAAQTASPVSYGVGADTFHPVKEQHGMVASVDATATQVGVAILKQGGNAVDAAVAVGYALAVTHPQAGNLGGGGFMMIRTASGHTTSIDFREMAPTRASRDMFLDAQGNADSKKSLTSHLASGVPGTVAGFALANKEYGTLPLSKLIAPAIRLADKGIVVNESLADDLKVYGKEVLLSHDNSKAIFFKPDGTPYLRGEKLVQRNLAHSLTLIAKLGPDAFYKGAIAEQIAKEMAANGGLIDKADMANYKAAEIKPGKLAPYESNQTTHFSVVDKQGNAVAVTYTLNTNFGSGIVAVNSGILMNNEMDDFSARPGTPNVYGLVGGEANAVQPYKRPLSSMSPTIVAKDGKTWLVTGSRIITTVLQMVVNSIDYGMNIAEATAAPRFHHQWLPDQLRVEKGFSPDTLKLLEAKGQHVKVLPAMGSTQSIMIGPDGTLYGASDPRTIDDLTAGY